MLEITKNKQKIISWNLILGEFNLREIKLHTMHIKAKKVLKVLNFRLYTGEMGLFWISTRSSGFSTVRRN